MNEKKLVGYTSGVFDMFHIGHLRILERARSKCDYLVVAVSTDELVQGYKNKTPIIPYSDRAQIVSSIRYVDLVVPQTSRDKFAAWELHKFNVMFVGDDWKGKPVFQEAEKKLKDVGMNNNPQDITGKVAICVLSFDGASDLWQPFFDRLFDLWTHLKLPVYLLTNYKQYKGKHNVTTLAIGEDLDWSSNLLKALDEIKERHVLFIFDDFILRSVDVERAEYFILQCVEKDWPYLTLYPNNYMTQRLGNGLRRISENGVYRCTLVYGIFRKDILAGLLKPGESAWDFEIESGVRARGLTLYSVEKRIFSHYHLLRKGKWLRPGFQKLAKTYKLNCSRPIEGIIEYLIRETKEWIFRKYHRFTPGSLIEYMESRRKDRG